MTETWTTYLCLHYFSLPLPTIVNHLSKLTRARASWASLSSLTGCWWPGFVQAISTTECPRLWQPGHAWKTASYNILFSVSLILPTSSSMMLPQPGRGDADVPLKTEHLMVFNAWLWVSAVITAHCERKLLWRKKTATLLYNNKHEYAGGNLTGTELPSRKMIVVTSGQVYSIWCEFPPGERTVNPIRTIITVMHGCTNGHRRFILCRLPSREIE